MSRILVTGKDGQVGFELLRSLARQGQVIAVGREQMDLSKPDTIRRTVREIGPDLIVNAAAYTAVDQAESEPELALAVNGIAPGVFAEEAKRLGAALIQPQDRRAQRLTVFINVDHRAALGGQRHAADQASIDIQLRPQFVAGLAQTGPVILRVLLGPARLAGVVGPQFDLAFADQVAVEVEQKRTHALRSVVDRQQVAFLAQGNLE